MKATNAIRRLQALRADRRQDPDRIDRMIGEVRRLCHQGSDPHVGRALERDIVRMERTAAAGA